MMLFLNMSAPIRTDTKWKFRMKSSNEKKRIEYAQLIFAPKDSDNNIVVFGAATTSDAVLHFKTTRISFIIY